MTRTDRIIEVLEAEKTNGELTEYGELRNATIDSCIEIIRCIGNEPPTEEEIELVAIAISPWRSGKDMRMRYHDFSWEKVMPNVQDAYRNQARAALTAFLGQEGK